MKTKQKQNKKVPDGWETKRLGDVLAVGSGKDYKNLGCGDIPVFGTGGYMLSVDASLGDGETVFIGRKGTIDKPFYYSGKFWTVDTLFYTREFNDTTAKYINLVFHKINWRMYNEASGVPSLSKSTIERISFTFPPLPEQKRIVKVLETWDAYIEKLERKIAVKKNIKKGLMQQLLTGKKRLPGFSGEWEEKKLGDICEKGESAVSANTLDDNSGKFPVYGASGFIKNIDFYTQENPYIAIVKDGAGVGRLSLHAGKTSVLGTLNVILPKEGTNLYFLYPLLKTLHFSKYNVGSTIPHIYFKDYKIEKLLIPKLKEQKEIAEVLTTADKEIEAFEQQLALVREQKKYLLNNLVTGEIRVPENV